MLKAKEVLGDLIGYSKDMGFHTAFNNGVTTVTIRYTCDYTEKPVYEKFELVDRGQGFKIFGYEYNVNKDDLSKDKD